MQLMFGTVLASLFLASAPATASADSRPEPKRRPVARFEAPRSVGTPLDEVVRAYRGVGLADRIAGRLQLETDTSLTSSARELIRRRLAEAT